LKTGINAENNILSPNPEQNTVHIHNHRELGAHYRSTDSSHFFDGRWRTVWNLGLGVSRAYLHFIVTSAVLRRWSMV
jgi:hypothetical protein